MILLNTSLIRKTTLFLVATIFSLSSFALDFNQTQRLANQGNASAQYNLGLKYFKGEGVRQDYNKAFDLYQKAANQGYAGAQNNLGLMYSRGNGVLQNYISAKELFKKSCDNGYQYGCNNYRIFNRR